MRVVQAPQAQAHLRRAEEFDQVRQGGALAQQRLLFLFGQSALRLSVNLESAQFDDDPDSRTEEPYVFSVPFLENISAGASMTLFDASSMHGLDERAGWVRVGATAAAGSSTLLTSSTSSTSASVMGGYSCVCVCSWLWRCGLAACAAMLEW